MVTSPPSRASEARGRLLVLAVPDGAHLLVLVAGEVDGPSASLLRDRLVDSLFYRPRSILIDATDLTFCDVRGLDGLLDAVAVAEHSGADVTVLPSAQLAWLMGTVSNASRMGGQPDRDPSGCPPSRVSRRTA